MKYQVGVDVDDLLVEVKASLEQFFVCECESDSFGGFNVAVDREYVGVSEIQNTTVLMHLNTILG